MLALELSQASRRFLGAARRVVDDRGSPHKRAHSAGSFVDLGEGLLVPALLDQHDRAQQVDDDATRRQIDGAIGTLDSASAKRREHATEESQAHVTGGAQRILLDAAADEIEGLVESPSITGSAVRY